MSESCAHSDSTANCILSFRANPLRSFQINVNKQICGANPKKFRWDFRRRQDERQLPTQVSIVKPSDMTAWTPVPLNISSCVIWPSEVPKTIEKENTQEKKLEIVYSTLYITERMGEAEGWNCINMLLPPFHVTKKIEYTSSLYLTLLGKNSLLGVAINTMVIYPCVCFWFLKKWMYACMDWGSPCSEAIQVVVSSIWTMQSVWGTTCEFKALEQTYNRYVLFLSLFQGWGSGLQPSRGKKGDHKEIILAL